MFRIPFGPLACGLSLILVACGGTAAPSATSAPSTTAAQPTSQPTVHPTSGAAVVPTTTSDAAATVAPTTTSSAALSVAATSTHGASASTPNSVATQTSAQSTEATGAVEFQLASEGTEARYRVREQLAQRSFPSDAVGATKAISGKIVLDADGKILSDQSKFVVDLKTLESDRSQRDGFIQRATLQTARYPTAEFVPTEIRGLASPFPTSGKVSFQLVGDLAVHGVTHQVTWDVTGQVDGKDVTGQATTSFKFEDFGMSPPRVAVVLSVEDNIKLEVDFHLVRSA